MSELVFEDDYNTAYPPQDCVLLNSKGEVPMKVQRFFLVCLFMGLMMSPQVNAKDVSSEIRVGNSGLVLGCITRLHIYAGKTLNMMKMPDKNFQQKMVLGSIQIMIPYIENIRNAAWSKYPLNQDWNKFYQQQNNLVKKHLETTNSWYDAMTCTQNLLSIGVMYPVVKDPSKMPPEQRAILMKQMKQR